MATTVAAVVEAAVAVEEPAVVQEQSAVVVVVITAAAVSGRHSKPLQLPLKHQLLRPAELQLRRRPCRYRLWV